MVLLPYTSLYRGARFYKADLQLQTPADMPRWRGLAYESHEEFSEDLIARSAEEGIEVLAITDHNFASKDMLSHLREFLRSRGLSRKLVVFPGFELQAHVGQGCHVLCLFSPNEDLDKISHTLTLCGIEYPHFEGDAPKASLKTLSEIIEIVQSRVNDETLLGLVICPHPMGSNGLFDNDAISEWLQAKEYTNPDLLALEIPKPVSEMPEGWQRLFASDARCQPLFRRVRPLATIMSSDAKALRPNENPDNYLGKRYTWVKMSKPSLEGLRQAFLDHGSRIRLGSRRPEDERSHAAIRSIRVSGARFLDDLKIEFSQSLNCLIGGGGTGKSTLIEYIAIASGQGGLVESDGIRHTTLSETLGPDSIVEVVLELDNEQFTVRAQGGKLTSNAPVESDDLRSFFPVRIFRQREIFAIAQDAGRTAGLIDDLIREELGDLDARASALVTEIEVKHQQIQQIGPLRRRLAVVKAEIEAHSLKLKSLEGIAASLATWRKYSAAEAVRVAVADTASEFQLRLTALSSAQGFLIEEELKREYPSLAKYGDMVRAAITKALSEVTKLSDEFKADVESALRTLEPDWKTISDQAQVDFASAQKAIEDSGADPAAYKEYVARVDELNVEVASISKQMAILESEKGKRAALYLVLNGVWEEQFALRSSACERLQASIPDTATGEPFLRITCAKFGDKKSLSEYLLALDHDRRRLSDEDVRIIVSSACALGTVDKPATEVLAEWLAVPWDQLPESFPFADARHREAFRGMYGRFLWKLRLFRIPDRVTVTLLRNDGSVAGDLDGTLSVGQKCTTILTMLLAQDSAPAVIDQPEDELDSEYTFTQLVPLLRAIKDKRQLIIATHDPNIPVNADAELIVPLEARDGRGRQKTHGQELVIGSLDDYRIKLAVEEIMEGSAEAFKWRGEKYGF